MLNIEKYEKELRKYGTYFALTNEGKLVNCEGLCCRNCAFNGKCAQGRMEWLLEEYEEPILAEEDKRILKDIINVYNSFNKKIVDIRKYHICRGCSLHIDYIDRGEETSCIETHATLPFNGDKLFKGMELGKTYTLEELGL